MFRRLFDLRLVLALYISCGLVAQLLGLIYLSYLSIIWYSLVVFILLFTVVLFPIRIRWNISIFYSDYWTKVMKLFFLLSTIAWIRFYVDVISSTGVSNLVYLRSAEYALNGRYDDTYFNLFSRLYMFSIIFFFGRYIFTGLRGFWFYSVVGWGLVFSILMMTRAPVLNYFAALLASLIFTGNKRLFYGLVCVLVSVVLFVSLTIDNDFSVLLLYAFGSLEALGLIIDGSYQYEVDKMLLFEPFYYVGSKLGLSEALDYIRRYVHTSNGRTNVYTFLDSFVIDFGAPLGLVVIGIYGLLYGALVSWSSRFRNFMTLFSPVLLYINFMVFMNNEFLRIGFWFSVLLISVASLINSSLYDRSYNSEL